MMGHWNRSLNLELLVAITRLLDMGSLRATLLEGRIRSQACQSFGDISYIEGGSQPLVVKRLYVLGKLSPPTSTPNHPVVKAFPLGKYYRMRAVTRLWHLTSNQRKHRIPII